MNNNIIKIDDLTNTLVLVAFKDKSTANGWLVRDDKKEGRYLILSCFDNKITSFSLSHIKYLAYINGACFFKYQGKNIFKVVYMPNELSYESYGKLQRLAETGEINH